MAKYSKTSNRTQVKGLDTVIANLNKAVAQIKNQSLQGLIESAVLIHRHMETVSPMIPVDTANLRHSWFVKASNGVMQSNPQFIGERASELTASHASALAESNSILQGKMGVVMGFSANYAAPVHEMTGDINWQRPGSGAKFFQSAISANRNQILKIVKQNVKI